MYFKIWYVFITEHSALTLLTASIVSSKDKRVLCGKKYSSNKDVIYTYFLYSNIKKIYIHVLRTYVYILSIFY